MKNSTTTKATTAYTVDQTPVITPIISLEKGYIYELRFFTQYCYIFANSSKEAREIYQNTFNKKATSVEKRGKKISRKEASNWCINL